MVWSHRTRLCQNTKLEAAILAIELDVEFRGRQKFNNILWTGYHRFAKKGLLHSWVRSKQDLNRS